MTTDKPRRVRAEKMKEIDGVMHRHCSKCQKYLTLEQFNDRKPLASKREPTLSAKYQTYCKACSTLAQASYRSKRKQKAAEAANAEKEI